ncbi:MAG: hypothetical protein ACYSTT_10350 [Planctomycetota bacterium]|jgi:hypothetical protein
MNRYQRLAWWNIIVITFTIIITTAAISIEFHIRGYSTLGIYFIAPLVLLKFNRFLFKKPQSEGGVISDERDNLIIKRALVFTFMTFWWVFLISSFLLWWFIGPRNYVPTITLPLMVLGGGIFMKIVFSVAILVLYGRGLKGE